MRTSFNSVKGLETKTHISRLLNSSRQKHKMWPFELNVVEMGVERQKLLHRYFIESKANELKSVRKTDLESRAEGKIEFS